MSDLRIGLIGAIGAGKTDFALQLGKRLDRKFTIIDNYAEVVSDRLDMPLGPLGSYVYNVGMAVERVGLERNAPGDFITCGTTLDSIVYQSIESFARSSFEKETEEFHLTRTNVIMTYMGMLMADTWRYTHTFYLPLTAAQRDDEENAMASQVDDELFVAIDSFDTGTITLPASSADRVGLAVQTILEGESDEEAAATEGL